MTPKIGAEGNRAAAVVVGEDCLAEGGETVGLGHGRSEDGGVSFHRARVVLPVGVADVVQVAARELPSGQTVGECQVLGLVMRPSAAKAPLRFPRKEQGEQIISSRYWHAQIVHHRVSDADRTARRGCER